MLLIKRGCGVWSRGLGPSLRFHRMTNRTSVLPSKCWGRTSLWDLVRATHGADRQTVRGTQQRAVWHAARHARQHAYAWQDTPTRLQRRGGLIVVELQVRWPGGSAYIVLTSYMVHLITLCIHCRVGFVKICHVSQQTRVNDSTQDCRHSC